jgi:hypothetical protein
MYSDVVVEIVVVDIHVKTYLFHVLMQKVERVIVSIIVKLAPATVAVLQENVAVAMPAIRVFVTLAEGRRQG